MRAVLLFLLGCTGATPEPPAVVDTSDTPPVVEDTDTVVAPEETSDTADDSAGDDTGWPEAADGYGTLTGDCGALRFVDLGTAVPQLRRNVIDFEDEAFDVSLLSAEGRTVAETPNRGGTSTASEAISFEVLRRCEAATLLETEADILYEDPNGKKTDILVDIDGGVVGVSVTRAFVFPPGTPMSAERATEQLTDKLGDAVLADANVADSHTWSRHILHVIAFDAQHADAMSAAWQELHDTVGGDTLVLITVTEGDDGFLYNLD
jgi:hypothetical protein